MSGVERSALRRHPWLASGLVTVVGLLSIEGGFRVAHLGPDDTAALVTEPDPDLLTRNRPSFRARLFARQVPVTIDQNGFRNGSVEEPKAPGIVRIVALGDSATFGYGVGDDETFCARLQARYDLEAAAGGPRVEVVNAGVIGSSSYQGLLLYRRVVTRFNPDILVVSFALNDAVESASRLPAPGMTLADLPRPSRLATTLHRELYVRSVAGRWLLEWMALRKWRAADAAFHYGEVLQDHQRLIPPATYRMNLRTLAADAAARGTRTVILGLPVRLRCILVPPFEPPLMPTDRWAVADPRRATRQAIARTHDRTTLSAMWFRLGGLDRSAGEIRRSLDDYLMAMELADFRQDLRWGGYHYADLAAGVAAESGLPFVNALLHFYERELGDNPADLYVDPYHPGVLGHQLIADLLHDTLAPLVTRPRRAPPPDHR